MRRMGREYNGIRQWVKVKIVMEHVPIGTGLAADEGSWLLSWKGLAGILILSWNRSGQLGT